MRVFVTGSTGLLGTNLVHALAASGHEVLALSRSPEKARRILTQPNVSPVMGDMQAVDRFAPSLDGCSVLFHVAAFFRDYYQPGDHGDDLKSVNIEGTVRLMEEAAKRGVARVIYVSSSGVIGMKPSGEPGDENTPPGPLASSNHYFRSKVLAEQALDDFEKHHSVPIVRILPGWMFGPYDSGPTGAGQLVLNYLSKRIYGVLDGGSCVVDARDVAQAMIAAAEKEAPARRYLVGGVYATLDDIFQLLAKVSGVQPPRVHFPYPLVYTAAVFEELSSRITGRSATVTRQTARLMRAALKVDSSLAVRDLRISFRPLEETLRDEVAWFRKEGAGA